MFRFWSRLNLPTHYIKPAGVKENDLYRGWVNSVDHDRVRAIDTTLYKKLGKAFGLPQEHTVLVVNCYRLLFNHIATIEVSNCT